MDIQSKEDMNKFLTKEELRAKFGWEEYFIFTLMLGVSAGIGIYFWRKGQKSNSEFLLGGQGMGTFPMTLSLVASFMSAITLLGTPAEMYVFGTQYILLVLSYPFVMAATVYGFLPVFYHLKVSTSYEYLEWRFNKAVRIIASSCFTIQMTLYMAIVVYAPALALAQITGFNVDLACAVIFLVCIFYTAIGGIKAVMWTDTFQSIVMFGSFLAVIIKGNYDAGGANRVFDLNYATNRVEIFNFDLNPTTRHTVWSLVLGGFFTWISIYGINQTQIQRYLTVPKIEMAATAIWWQILGIGSLLMMCAYAGMVIFAFYQSVECDPIKIQLVDKKDQLFPLFVMQVMGDIPCIPGLFVAGVFSGALSTVSSGLNSLAAVMLKDFFEGGCNAKLSEKAAVWTTKGLAVTFGIISYLVVFVVKYLPGVLEAALGVFGIVGGPVLGAFTLGMFVPWANTKGAVCGMISSLALTMWIGFGQTIAKHYKTYTVIPKETTIEGCPQAWKDQISNLNMTQSADSLENTSGGFNHSVLYEISYMWFSAIACLSCLIVGILVSFATGAQNPSNVDPKLISPAFKGAFGSLPGPLGRFFTNVDIGSNYKMTDKEIGLRDRQMSHGNEEVEKTTPTKHGENNPTFNREEKC